MEVKSLLTSRFIPTMTLLSTLTLFTGYTYGMETSVQNEDVTENNVMQQAIKKANSELLCAAQTGNLAKIKQLIMQAIANLNTLNDNQSTPLILAASEGRKDIVECLIKANVNLNAINKYGYNALMLAARDGYTDCAKLLIEAGADLEVANANGSTALLLAVKNDNTDIAKMLINAGAKMNVGYECILHYLFLALYRPAH